MSTFMNKIFNTPLLQNKFVLYAILFVVLFTVVRHISNGNMNAVVLMALIGLLTSYFSKNMIIVLLTVFSSVFILEMIGSQGVVEGMETKKEKEKDNEKDEKETDEDTSEKKEKNKESKEMSSDGDKKESLQSKNEPKKKTKQGMTTLSPASYDGEDHDSESAHRAKEGNRIDYASTLEEAYDNIENIIGEDGVRGLTDQTKSLMNQQKELMNNMKEMGPLLKSAEGFMAQLTGNGGIRGITDMLKGFATPGGGKK